MRDEDIPDINNPKTMKAVLEGDKLMKEVLNGGYNVHPVPPPNSEIKERIRKRYERERIKIEKLFTLDLRLERRTLCLQSNIEEVLSLSFYFPISYLWFWNSSCFLSSFSFF